MKRKYLLLFAFSLIIIIGGVIYFNGFKEYKINRVLKTEAYSYLPKSAKKLIKDNYMETGVLVRTEKNKEENVPYLNPNYIEYLNLSSAQKNDVDVIPNIYNTDYNYSNVKGLFDLPASFDLRSVRGSSYITPLNLKNQGNTGLCWAFATTEHAESHLMLKYTRPYSNSTTLFSPRQIDYATSNNGIKDFQNPNGFRNLLDAGNFSMASEIMSYGLSLIKENKMPFNESTEQRELNDVLNFNNSEYELNQTIELPRIEQNMLLSNRCSANDTTCLNNLAQEMYDDYIETIKSSIMNYGGGVINVTSPNSSCGYKNTNNTYALTVLDNCFKLEDGHAMHVIGWDDNYQYSYCKESDKNTNKTQSNCTGEYVTGKGAFILRNSWGNVDKSIVYLTYDSFNSSSSSPSVFFIRNMNDGIYKIWDNYYTKNFDYLANISLNTRIKQDFTKKISGQEKIQKIKFNTMSADGFISVRIYDGTSYETYENILYADLPGMYTIDLSDRNIIIDNDNFSIELFNSSAYIINNSITVYTKNVNTTPIIKTSTNNIILETSTNNYYSTRVYSNLKNILPNQAITYELKNKYNNNNFSSYLEYDNNFVSQNDVNTSIRIRDTIPDGKYILTIRYGNASENITLNIGELFARVYFVDNKFNHSKFQIVEKQLPFDLELNTFTQSSYIFKGWKTENNEFEYQDGAHLDGIESDLYLYAVWEPIVYKVKFNKNTGLGKMPLQSISYDALTPLNTNTFVKNGYYFKEWNDKSDGTGNKYQDGQVVKNLADEQDEVFNLYAQWSPINYSISFNSNGGVGSMDSLSMTYGVEKSLPANSFTRDKYDFIGWNTKSDGTGDSYSNLASVINLTTEHNSTVVLYAMWKKQPVHATSISLNKKQIELYVGQSETLIPAVLPEDADDVYSWSSSSNKIARVSSGGVVLALKEGTATVTVKAGNVSDTCTVVVHDVLKVSYSTHVQTYGWKPYVSNGATSGTVGEAKRLEGIKIKLDNNIFGGGIEYRTHVQTYGWEKTFKKDNEVSGTQGESKRLEAIEIRLTGSIANDYDIYYRVHAQTFGWLGWAKNGESAGTAGYAKRLEAIQIKLVEKDTPFSGYGKSSAYKEKHIEYNTHVQTYGWQDYSYDGLMAGTQGEAKRLEAITIRLANQRYSGNVLYRTHIQSFGWEHDFKKNGEVSGKTGLAKRLEAIEIKLDGEMADHYDIYYRVHAQTFGWLNWAKNGERSGTAGLAKRLEAIEIVLVDKGEEPPTVLYLNDRRAYIENT